MLNKLALFMVAALAINAQASVKVDYRQDLKTVNYDEKSSSEDYGAFQVQTARVDFKGNINENVAARVRVKLNKNSETVTKNEKLSDFVDYAYFTNKISDSLSIKFGKMFSEIGGVEAQTSSADMYLVSNTFNSYALYLSGLNVSYKMGDHSFSYLMLNRSTDVTTSVSGGSAYQRRFLNGLVYSGAFMEKALTVRVSYHTEQLGEVSKDAAINYMDIGLKYDAGSYNIEFDQLTNTFVKATSSRASATKNDSNADMVITARMKGDNWNPMFKYTSRTTNSQGTDGSKYSGLGLAAEYVPVKGEDFRYHLAYNQFTTTPVTGDATSYTEMFAGVRLAMDVLK